MCGWLPILLGLLPVSLLGCCGMIVFTAPLGLPPVRLGTAIPANQAMPSLHVPNQPPCPPQREEGVLWSDHLRLRGLGAAERRVRLPWVGGGRHRPRGQVRL